LSVATSMLQEAESDETFMGQIITGNETWVYGYDPATKHQSSQWKSADSPEAKESAPGAVKSESHAHCLL